MPSPLTIVHRVSIPQPATHLVHVETTLSDCPGAWDEPRVLFMPVWTPGSYLVREYARHVEGLEVRVLRDAPPGSEARPVTALSGTSAIPGASHTKADANAPARADAHANANANANSHARTTRAARTAAAGSVSEARVDVSKIRKNAWRVHAPGAQSIVVRYRVYAAELTVRTSYVDESHAFLVPASIFLGVEGHEDDPLTLVLRLPAAWRVATPLPAKHPSRIAAPGHEEHGADPAASREHTFEATDFDVLVDSPIECGIFRDGSFDVLGRPHRYSICPADAIGAADWQRLVQDTKTIVETEAKLFGGELPYRSYDFLLHVSARSRGGLEHRESAALIAPPASFASREGYLDLLSLVAHELLHAWNIKRIKPEGLTPYRYGEECYTRLLWWFEGVTSYYDWRVLMLSRLCTVDEYLDHLGGEIAHLDQTYGRLVQSLESASFDAWIKLYRPDENTANSAVSYYRKGEIVAALLDLEIRARTGGRASLDDVLARLWTEYGRAGKPVPEDGMQAIFERVASVPLGDLFDAWIRAPGEIDYARTLSHVGLAVERTAKPEAPPWALGLRARVEAGRTLVASVVRTSGAWKAGVQAGDELVAIGNARVEGANLDGLLRARAPGEQVELLVIREGRVLLRSATLDPPRLERVKLVVSRDATPAAREAFTEWLGQPPPSRGRASS